MLHHVYLFLELVEYLGHTWDKLLKCKFFNFYQYPYQLKCGIARPDPILTTGFTLIELIMVILVIGILAVVAAPRFVGHSMELSGAAKKLAMDIRYCQELNMIRQGENWRLGFAADHYFLWRDDNHDGNKNGAEPFAVDPVGQVDYQVYLSSMHLDSLTLNPAGISNHGIGFSGQGKPLYDGSASDYSGIDFILSKGNEQVTLHLESVTGNVFYK